MFTQADIVNILRDAVFTVLIVSAPMTLVALAIGLFVSVIQATTQLHEATLAFVPKIIGVFLALVIFAGTMMTLLMEFTIRMFGYIDTMLR